jgi:hypothetical protein
MNAEIYGSLFRLRDKILFVACTSFLALQAFLASVPKRQGRSEVDATLFLLFPPLILGAVLAGIWNKPLQRQVSALCPNIQPVLFRWHISLVLIAAVGWAVIAHAIEPALSLFAAIGISSAMFTLPLPFGIGQPMRRTGIRFIFPLVGLVIGAALGPLPTERLGAKILSHASSIGALGFVLTGINLWLTQKRKPRAVVAQAPTSDEIPSLRDLFGRIFPSIRQQREVLPEKPSPTYPARGASLFRWVQAAFEESPHGWLFRLGGMLGFSLFCPWLLQRAADYPVGWYRTVFSPNGSGNATGSMTALIVVLFVSGLKPGLLRTGQLYPISRQRRVTIAFATSAASFALDFFVIVGGSLCSAWIVGWYLDLPLPVRPASEFVVRMAMVLPFMPMVRRAGLRLEQSQSFMEILILIGGVLVLLFVAESLLLEAGLQTGALVCVASIVTSQFLYYSSLRKFYTKGDLVRRGDIHRSVMAG